VITCSRRDKLRSEIIVNNSKPRLASLERKFCPTTLHYNSICHFFSITIIQCFRILDKDDKGYLTFDDLRVAADDTDCGLSNRQIMEMLGEADTSGDSKVNLEEFTIIMLRSSAFNFP